MDYYANPEICMRKASFMMAFPFSVYVKIVCLILSCYMFQSVSTVFISLHYIKLYMKILNL